MTAPRAEWREEAGLGVCSDPRREFGRDYRILALLDEIDAYERACIPSCCQTCRNFAAALTEDPS